MGKFKGGHMARPYGKICNRRGNPCGCPRTSRSPKPLDSPDNVEKELPVSPVQITIERKHLAGGKIFLVGEIFFLAGGMIFLARRIIFQAGGRKK